MRIRAKPRRIKYGKNKRKERTNHMKETICTITGIVGSFLTGMFGGWSAAMTTLLIFMAVDYISGLAVAGIFKKSTKTDSGALESRAGWKGLCRKCMTLVFVLIAYRLDITIHTSYIKDAVCIAFIANELISIIENAGLMGIKIPVAIQNAVDILTKKGSGNNEKSA